MPGQQADGSGLESTLPKNINNCLILGDKGYDWDSIRIYLEQQGAIPVIPPRKGRKNPAEYDNVIGKLRHRVENFFCRIKRHKRIALRAEQKPQNFLGFVTLSAIEDYGIL